MPMLAQERPASVFEPDQYELLDFGAGRKLERFGAEILDRPSPAADGTAVAHPDMWGSASARYEQTLGSKGEWSQPDLASLADESNPWSVRHGGSRLLMQLSASGNVGLFPEQAGNWDWISDQVRRFNNSLPDRPPKILNLFAYTGGASLAAAAAGAEVTHVDSSGPTVAWAKRNAAVSRLADLPIRWLVEDAIKFVSRECRRGNRYDGIIADPPTYGHGPKGRAFKFVQHVDELIELCAELLEGETSGNRFFLFSCHAPGFGPDDASATVATALPASDGSRMTTRPLFLEVGDGRRLAAGVSTRWTKTTDG